MKRIPVFVFALLSSYAVFSQVSRVAARPVQRETLIIPDDMKKSLHSYKIVSIDVSTLTHCIDRDNSMCGFTLIDGNIETAFTLWPHDLHGREYKASGAVKAAKVANRRWFKGYVNNDRKAIARLTIDGNTIEGLYYNKGKAIAIEPLSHYIKTSRPGEHVIYEVSEIEGAVMKCDASAVSALQRTDGAARSGNTPGETMPRLIQIATDATSSYYQLYGADTNDHILSILNVVEGLYERDFGITFRVTFQHYFTDGSDPYTGDGQELLSQFQDNWNRNWPDVPRHIAFLFHGKLLDSGVLGRAYQAQACEDVSYGYGFMALSFSAYETKVTAHEIGHLFGAQHETAESCNVSLSVMCTSVLVGAPFEFSPVAKAAISAFLGEHECFEMPLQATLYPVPATSTITVITSEPDFSVALYNLFGQQVLFRQYVDFSGAIPLGDLSEGIYIARISAGGKTVSRRIEVTR